MSAFEEDAYKTVGKDSSRSDAAEDGQDSEEGGPEEQRFRRAELKDQEKNEQEQDDFFLHTQFSSALFLLCYALSACILFVILIFLLDLSSSDSIPSVVSLFDLFLLGCGASD